MGQYGSTELSTCYHFTFAQLSIGINFQNCFSDCVEVASEVPPPCFGSPVNVVICCEYHSAPAALSLQLFADAHMFQTFIIYEAGEGVWNVQSPKWINADCVKQYPVERALRFRRAFLQIIPKSAPNYSKKRSRPQDSRQVRPSIAVKQEQEEISTNHVHIIILCSVLVASFSQNLVSFCFCNRFSSLLILVS